MSIVYDRNIAKYVDAETGMIIGRYGWADDGGVSFGFCDPKSDAMSYGRPWFRFSAFTIVDETSAEPNPAKRPILGYRVRGLKRVLAPYHQEDLKKLNRALLVIEAGLAADLMEVGITNPLIDMA